MLNRVSNFKKVRFKSNNKHLGADADTHIIIAAAAAAAAADARFPRIPKVTERAIKSRAQLQRNHTVVVVANLLHGSLLTLNRVQHLPACLGMSLVATVHGIQGV